MIFDLLKPEVVPCEEGQSELHYEAHPLFTIPGGVMQGGIVTAMLDMAMAFAAGGNFSTASIHVEIHRPVTSDKMIVKAHVTKKGRRIVFAAAEMRDLDGKLLAKGTQTAVPLTQE